jgi:hypothetical protein
VSLDPSTLLWSAPLVMLLGGYLLIRCIGGLRRVISPDVCYRWADPTHGEVVTPPQPGRYVINIVFPPFTVVTGTAHFAADFAVTACASGKPAPYKAYSRFNVFTRAP